MKSQIVLIPTDNFVVFVWHSKCMDVRKNVIWLAGFNTIYNAIQVIIGYMGFLLDHPIDIGVSRILQLDWVHRDGQEFTKRDQAVAKCEITIQFFYVFPYQIFPYQIFPYQIWDLMSTGAEFR